jgi:hypothetical protein
LLLLLPGGEGRGVTGFRRGMAAGPQNEERFMTAFTLNVRFKALHRTSA